MKKKPFDLKKLVLFGGIPAALIAILTGVVTFSKTVSVYADLPKDVAQVKSDVVDVKAYIQKQQIANELMQKFVTQNKEAPDDERVIKNSEINPIFSPDGKSFWDADMRKWRPVEE